MALTKKGQSKKGRVIINKMKPVYIENETVVLELMFARAVDLSFQ